MAAGAVVTDGNLPPVNKDGDPELKKMREELNRLVGKVDKIGAPPPRQDPPPQPGQPLSKKELETRFYQNPLESTAQIATAVAQSMRAQDGSATYDTMVEVAKGEARKGQEKLWDKYATEVEALVFTSTEQNPLVRQNIFVWKNAFNQVKGNHVDELISEAKAEPAGGNRSAAIHISDEGGPSAPSRAAGPPPAGDKLSAEEQTMARNLGLSNEQYAEGKRRYDAQDSKPSRKSSWDDLMTFDTRQKRREQRAAAAASKK